MVQGGVGISGMGRIGRLLVRAIFSKQEPLLPLKAINCIYPVETVAHLLKYDTVHGRWDADIAVRDGQLILNGHCIQVTFERQPERIPWSELGVELVIDATGQFNDRQGALRHIQAGAARVLITAPGQAMDLTVVMGVNDHAYDPAQHRLVSAASCTTNCVAPVLHLLDRAFQVQSGWITTVHSYTSDQNHLDNPHKDLRRARACTESIVPTTTGFGKALTDVLPHLAPHVQGLSLRVPTQDVSLADLTVKVSRETTVEEVRTMFRSAAEGSMGAYVGYTEEPLVSADYIGCAQSAVVDGISMMVMGSEIKVLAWYDNEWAYASRVVELGQLMMERVGKPWKAPLVV
ncbi:type I glyceraldehyde-3-phosphate dehydrogenase [Paenibacillus cremeus]|uniref:Type I glyceraldehyde-3-phosphate dehydrogenase n=1 Tax=Paenibacillus cremeus TaxID=2163881 RepID=A0A559KBA8_9BACL|nr:type I glyceraldehyde-3-phosphate dehydrogenase [Paenibacillus cremeus]TVY09411.1 type I glyceraldehyde-3-phosphate dehydrogenase [Paenibacillus cremeus]